jgi:hypothetical protein
MAAILTDRLLSPRAGSPAAEDRERDLRGIVAALDALHRRVPLADGGRRHGVAGLTRTE